MEEEKELLKHVCKFCSKSFGCGRSLGGHMRSHMINDITAQPDGTQLTKKKLPPLTSNSCYVLRENPKKTWRISDHKSCRDCGKEFQSWKALFGHMKCHSVEKDQIFIKEKQQEDEQEESWASVMNCHSDDNETTAAVAVSNRQKRSQRKTRQVMGTTTASSSMSEIEQEQEEVAICLMMLSRDIGGFSSVAESSDNNSVFLENKSTKPEEQSVSGIPRKVTITKKKKSQLDDESVVENSGTELGKRKFSETSRFECTTCNKTFHSYQALGGHRASHKKNKGCYNSAIDSTENSIETFQLIPDEAKLSIKSENSVDFETKKSKGVHTCPICLKNFPSGQALGGHKRSHLAASTIGAKNEMNLAVEEPIRDFLDLNLPAPCDEDSNGVMGFDQWWNSSSLKHEPLLGLISN